MPAPNIASLYDIESAYEDVLRNYFVNLNIGGQTFTQVVTPRTNINAADFLVTPRLQIKMSLTGLGSDGSGWKEDFTTSGNLATNYYSHYTAALTLDVVTSRSNSSQLHGLMRGATRQAMLETTAIMNATTLPYYETVFVTPVGSAQGIDEANDEIQTQLSYAMELFIPPYSYPYSLTVSANPNSVHVQKASPTPNTVVNITATASGGTSPYTYLWTGGQTGATYSNSFSLADITVTCTATDAHGATGSVDVPILIELNS